MKKLLCLIFGLFLVSLYHVNAQTNQNSIGSESYPPCDCDQIMTGSLADCCLQFAAICRTNPDQCPCNASGHFTNLSNQQQSNESNQQDSDKEPGMSGVSRSKDPMSPPTVPPIFMLNASTPNNSKN